MMWRRHRGPRPRYDRHRADIAAAIDRHLLAAGRGPAVHSHDELGRLVVRDRAGVFVATVGEWPAEHRPGVVVEARGADGRRWSPPADTPRAA